MRCSVNRLLQLATKPRLQSMRSDTSSHVWPSASSKISRARRASSARFVRLLARRVSSISSEFDNVMASLMDAIIVYKWLLQSTRSLLLIVTVIDQICFLLKDALVHTLRFLVDGVARLNVVLQCGTARPPLRWHGPFVVHVLQLLVVHLVGTA